MVLSISLYSKYSLIRNRVCSAKSFLMVEALLQRNGKENAWKLIPYKGISITERPLKEITYCELTN